MHWLVLIAWGYQRGLITLAQQMCLLKERFPAVMLSIAKHPISGRRATGALRMYLKIKHSGCCIWGWGRRSNHNRNSRRGTT